jgi:hypothetical protein
MSRNKTFLLTLLAGGGAYFYLNSRIPTWAIQSDGTYLPATFVDKLTVMLTGAVPPASKQQTTVNAINTGLQALSTALNPTAINAPLSGFYDQSYSPGIVPRIFARQRNG